MATDSRHHTTWGTRLRFFTRAVGMTGVVTAAVGVSLLATALPVADLIKRDVLQSAWDGTRGNFAREAILTALTGLIGVALAVIAELIGVLQGLGRRTAVGATSAIGTAAAITLLVFVNAYSFTHHVRRDYTRDKQFTLPTQLADRLRTLRQDAPTTIVVFQQHKTFGTLTSKPDGYDYAAERKVVEKVKDLVELFREFGPRFNVVVLDVEGDEYEKHLADLTKDAPELKSAIEAAPENSIFFHANKRVQRLSFNEFMQLDKSASREANGGRGNLVLLPQGVETFAHRVLAVQERRPKVALCVVHELLTSAYPEGRGKAYTLAGLRKSLTDHGFDVIDVVLKKNWASASSLDDLKPAADTREETRLERLEGELATAQINLAAMNRTARTMERIQSEIDRLKDRPWAERDLAYRQLVRGVVTEELEPEFVASLAKQSARAKQALEESKKKLKTAEDELNLALKDERPVEERRIADAKVKLTRKLADVDLLIVPRFTLEDATEGEGPDVPPNLHGLRKEQVEVIRDFMVAGKPVLACLGPISGPEGPLADSSDGFEKLLAERGIDLGQDTILFEGEAKAFAARLAGEQFGGGVPSDVPPLTFVEVPVDGRPKPNPIAAATRLTARSADQQFNVRAKALRPISLLPGWQDRIPIASEFLLTSPDSWNEERPFLQTERRRRPDGRVVRVVTYLPEFEATTVTDPKWGTRLAERKGPFSVGVAIESKVPAAWINEEYGREQFAAAMLSGSGMLGGVKSSDPTTAELAVGSPGTVGHNPTHGSQPPGLFAPADPVLAAGLTVAANQLESPTQRLVVFGSGNLFSGPRLEPAQEKLLLHTVNWLTGRDARLPRADLPEWSFPRVEMTDRELTLWRVGTLIWLPLVAIYLGLMTMMVRRLR